MRVLIFAVLMLAAGHSWSMTRGQFAGMQMIVNITSGMYDGTVDGSPQNLYLLMNRPEQETMLGKGKVLEAPKKMLNFICARRGENNYHCSIYIHQSNVAQIAPGKALLDVRGDQARALFEQFHSGDGRVSYRDEEGVFAIEATPERFVLKFDAQGV